MAAAASAAACGAWAVVDDKARARSSSRCGDAGGGKVERAMEDAEGCKDKFRGHAPREGLTHRSAPTVTKAYVQKLDLSIQPISKVCERICQPKEQWTTTVCGPARGVVPKI